MSNQVTIHTIGEADSGVRLDRWIRRIKDVPQGQIEKLLRTGQIRVDGRRIKSKERLTTGCSVRLPPLPEKALDKHVLSQIKQSEREYIRQMVIYEDEELIAINKPSGIAVQGGSKILTHIDGLLDALSNGDERPKLIHRLDKDTSGVLLLAKNTRAAADIGSLFRNREISKIYWAVTNGVPVPKSGQLRGWMTKSQATLSKSKEPSQGSREKMYLAKQNDKNAVHAITDYIVISSAAQKAAWVALRPHTGRTHQLRLHMAELGTSILGDVKYQTTRDTPSGLGNGLHLHAYAVLLPNKSTITAPLPKHMKNTFNVFGFLEQEAGKHPEEIFL